jgi:hypothetical protein
MPMTTAFLNHRGRESIPRGNSGPQREKSSPHTGFHIGVTMRV